MRQCWARGIADFAKYGLLKRLTGPELRLGVFWYLTTHAAPNRPWLSRPDEYGPCDRPLFETLRRLHHAKGDALTLADIERWRPAGYDRVLQRASGNERTRPKAAG